MLMLTPAQLRRALLLLVGFHILIICLSNYLVQLPFQLFGYHTTWGAFSFPFVYLATDLTVRIFGQTPARSIILKAMVPALMISYVMGVVFHQGSFQGMDSLSQWNTFVFRIAFASFAAYLIGQLMDITVFARLRQSRSWWVAPAASTIVGNLVDTLVFFSIAFYASTDSFMAANWPEIATVDYSFKLLVSLGLFLPAYGVLLKVLQDKILQTNPQKSFS
ncbi:7-cyano-7-deazaguanine/7-aminomethyl-7-deazaguanine transporter [Shewanella sp. LC6]|uniref:Probable queuosine precursor transporter n=1 Tax=Shewanella xiamenensis TaxID=332186 RepID=A0AAW6R0W7_9GAMM|nr:MULTISPECIES: 7-cyano-7-deazaguanine/7-aminomethyl-7-deazaguanine transporter [Shewanella]MDG5901496.1 7-cyano-7-deazaguanine/7-aminomethyl-7-deazaguanine transporter [Shewanella xiamenensis]QQK62003.1 7-cyano-7-deazaguanine/7-aminomethyl-7-deazaguanine transporter [Shewanella sp. LC6]TPE47036.1 7-cyano-7-deazaguanine/7-aminomethyl-7-deazaguanine transporter [Shewanella sp. LC2]